jgi:hypothetical protein
MSQIAPNSVISPKKKTLPAEPGGPFIKSFTINVVTLLRRYNY